VWLLSGSRDLERLVEVLRARGVKITLLNTDGMVPRELRNAVDRFLDLASLRPRLEKAEALQTPVFHRVAEPVRPEAARPEAERPVPVRREVVIGPST
jgi:hypothetical protein